MAEAVKTWLNGREVSAVEIAALSPEIIQRVEYHDTPEARYGNADVVLDFITKTTKLAQGFTFLYGRGF